MTDRPIIFSAPMVRALLAGRKSQTRRLESSPLAKAQPGDRLYVRESGIQFGERLFRHDVPATPAMGHFWVRHTLKEGASYNVADCSRSTALLSARAKVRPSIHMPRWASRLTLIVEGVKVERLKNISEADAIAEGIEQVGRYGGEPLWRNYSDGPTAAFVCPIKSYRLLWQSLHGAKSWTANPWVVALTFRVVRGNIDKVPA